MTIIKYRFSKTIIDKLLKVDFSKLTQKMIERCVDKLYQKITEENIDEMMCNFLQKTN